MTTANNRYSVIQSDDWVNEESAQFPALYFEKYIDSFVVIVKSWNILEMMQVATALEGSTGFKWDRMPIPGWEHNRLVELAQQEAAEYYDS